MNTFTLLLAALSLLQAVNSPNVDAKLREQAVVVANQAIAIAVEQGTQDVQQEGLKLAQEARSGQKEPKASASPESSAEGKTEASVVLYPVWPGNPTSSWKKIQYDRGIREFAAFQGGPAVYFLEKEKTGYISTRFGG